MAGNKDNNGSVFTRGIAAEKMVEEESLLNKAGPGIDMAAALAALYYSGGNPAVAAAAHKASGNVRGAIDSGEPEQLASAALQGAGVAYGINKSMDADALAELDVIKETVAAEGLEALEDDQLEIYNSFLENRKK